MNLLTPPARRRWMFAALALALLAALAIAFALGQRSPNPAADAQIAAPAAAPAGPAIAVDTPTEEPSAAFDDAVIPAPGIAPPSAHHVPLPPADAPLAEIFDELLDRLQRGDARAGCRLYREIRRCWRSAAVAGSHRRLMETASREDASAAELDIAIDLLALTESMTPGASQSTVVCAGIELERLENHYFDTVRRTAELGDALAMVEFAEGRAFLRRDYARHPERLALWHRLAPELLDRALQMGTPEAAWTLLQARMGGGSLLGELLANDPVEAEAMRQLLHRTHPGRRSGTDKDLSEAELQAAKERAELLYERYFRHRPQPEALRFRGHDLEPQIEHCEPLT